MPDYVEVAEALRGRPDPRAAAVAELAVRAQRHAADRLGRLLVLDEWQTFKALIQERIEQAEALLQAAHARLELEMLTGEALDAHVRGIYGLRKQIEAYQDVLTIPDRLQEAAPSLR